MDLNETVEVGDSVQIERKKHRRTHIIYIWYVRCHIQQHKMSHTLIYAKFNVHVNKCGVSMRLEPFDW